MDLLDQDSIADFKNALRDVTDTFHRFSVTLQPPVGAGIDLVAGVKPTGDGQGGNDGELRPRETGEEIEERLTVSFNREYLAEQGLVDQAGNLLITVDHQLLIKGKRYYLAAVGDRAIFRDGAIMVVCEAVR